MKVVHEKTGTVLGKNVLEAGWVKKILGLMFAADFGPYDGLFISWHNSVHNCFVRFSIDVVFIDKKNCVVKVVRELRPWRFTRFYFSARHTIEFPAGSISQNVVEGDQLNIVYE